MDGSYSKNNIKQIFYDLFPIQYFSFISNSLSQIINGIFVGKLLSSLDMVALGFYNPYQTILTVFSTVIASGSRIVCGKYVGRGQKDKINETFSLAIYVLFVFGIIATGCSIFLAPSIAKLLGTSTASFDRTVVYIRAMGVGLLPEMLSECLIVFLQMKNKSRYSLFAILLLAFSNLSLNFIASKTITFNLFIVGMINAISRTIMLIFIIYKYVRNNEMPRLVKTSNYRMTINIIKIGLPAGIFNVLVGLRNFVINKATLNYGGDNAINAISILNSIEPIYCGVAVGLQTVVAMLTSVYYGEKDRDSIKEVFKLALGFGEILTVLRLIIIVLFTDKIALLYGASPEVIENTKRLFMFYGGGMVFNIVAICFTHIYQSFGKSTYCNIIYFISVLLVNLFCSKVLSLSFGLNGIWFGYLLQEISIVAIVFIYAFIKNRKITFRLDDLLFLDNSIDVGEHITISINNIDDVINISRIIEEYCISQGVDKRRAMLSGLCLEEMATNIIEHGFNKSKKKNNTIDIYCDVDDNTKQVYLRIKDNAASFDPHTKIQNSDDPTTNIGIRLVSKIAKDMNYQNNFGLNVLTIKI